MPPFDPFDSEEYEVLRARARGFARAIHLDASAGEDALQILLSRIVAGDRRPLKNRPYFITCLVHQVRSIGRRDRRRVSLEQHLESRGSAAASDRRAFLLGLVEHSNQGASEEDEEARLRLIVEALNELDQAQRRAFKAQIRYWLVKDGGEEAVSAFEQMWEVDLGQFTGTDELAEAEGLSRGTIAPRAHRGQKRLAKIVQEREQ